MGAFTAYTFVAGVFLLASYLVYKCLLANENQPSFNRAVILCLYALSFLLPILPFPLNFGSPTDYGIIEVEEPTIKIAQGSASYASSLFFNIMLAIYLAGALFVTAITAISLFRIKRLIASGVHHQYTGYTLVLIPSKSFTPFSLGHYIVVADAEDQACIDMIISHELAHMQCHHYFDLIIAQAVCIVLWYNPASWLMLSELKAVHEYQADESVLRSGVSARLYQMLLIKKAVGARFPFLANSLNHSNLKKRITMMIKSKSCPARRLRALAAVPAVALAAFLLSVPAVSSTVRNISSSQLITFESVTVVAPGPSHVTLNPNVVETPDVLPQCMGGEAKLMMALSESVKYPAEALKNGIQGKVTVSFTVLADGTTSDYKIINSVNPVLDAEALRAVKALKVKWIPGKKDGKNVACSFALPVNFRIK